MRPQITFTVVAWLAADLRHGDNIRSDLGTDEELRRLGQSLAAGQDIPLYILADGTVIDGHRRLAAALLAGLTTLYCIVVPPDFTPADCKCFQWRTAAHRQDISLFDKAVAIRDTKAEFPGISNKGLAADVLGIDAGLVTKYLVLFTLIPEVQDAVKAGKLGINEWYALRNKSEQDQRAALNGSIPNGSKSSAPWSKLPKVTFPFVTKSAPAAVTVATDKPDDFDQILAVLSDAVKAVTYLKEQNVTVKHGMGLLSDRAIAAIQAKTPKTKPERTNAQQPDPQSAA